MDLVNEGAHSPKFSFRDDGDRPEIRKYTNEPKFRPNDEVYIHPPGSTTREGPFTISSVTNCKYTLCDESGNLVKDGNAFEEENLELVDILI